MAQYKYGKFLSQVSADTDAYDVIWNPGSQPINSGIYRCVGCGREVVGEKERTLPPQNHHQHTPVQGLIRWLLVVFAQGI